ncbi:glycosyltransferase family 2 protein [Solirubrobacter sp. CPCC 204708]|uniref:Glycosyltransferase family 2 protein n=1 Tax=Solirubrobacter deserti TaxID=2282478 RepID=A0ABT4RN85_9ACTN|nr:glycosyltransferase family A protein [Solirubrobacter deserti]MBE2317422.1 glycosyltransferase family 2 protein [Solirubrobacter deserti]MDA0140004.1 glycosyltransferase family 2 protein [Solirubrobacter deserti]
MLEVAFVLAPRQNHFFAELQDALRYEIEAAGVATSLHWGDFPAPRPGLVYAVIPPHEYFTLMHGRIGPADEVLARTMYICGEQPNTPFFDWNVHFAPRAGRVFDINRLGVRAFGEHGIEAEHLQLGHTGAWDRLSPDVERDIDVLFMGAESQKRLVHLAQAARPLRDRRCRFVLSDNSRPNFKASETYVAEDEKWNLLNRSKVLINIHQGDTPYFEWLRIVQAMANGCVVVTESSVDYEPLVPGEHFLSGAPETLGHLAEHLLLNGHRRWEIQTAAYETLRDQLPMRAAADKLIAAARELDERPLPNAQHPFFTQPSRTEAEHDAVLAQLVPGTPDEAPERGVLKALRLDLMDARRSLEKLTQRVEGRARPNVVVHRRSQGWLGARPKVSVLVTLFNYESHIRGALDSVLRSRERSWEILVVDDGSTDGSLAAADAWVREHDTAPVLLLRHPVNRGLADARNSVLALARGEFCFVLDADNEILPETFTALLAALEHDPEAAYAYGSAERFRDEEPVGLLNIYGWNPTRFRTGNYIDAMAMIRTARLREMGGYRRDRRLYGWEDFDLWVRMAEREHYGVFVPSVVARYRQTGHSMLTVTNVSGAEAKSVIAEAAPTIMSR